MKFKSVYVIYKDNMDSFENIVGCVSSLEDYMDYKSLHGDDSSINYTSIPLYVTDNDDEEALSKLLMEVKYRDNIYYMFANKMINHDESKRRKLKNIGYYHNMEIVDKKRKYVISDEELYNTNIRDLAYRYLTKPYKDFYGINKSTKRRKHYNYVPVNVDIETLIDNVVLAWNYSGGIHNAESFKSFCDSYKLVSYFDRPRKEMKEKLGIEKKMMNQKIHIVINDNTVFNPRLHRHYVGSGVYYY